eukprot:GILJ01003815.1.p1 GENE.GILJ01003815.1~~GILJ01003815.1.p1  ORF type:complete len:158 (+),score=21.84 GILJ01003815.1:298-771(+)
MSDFAEVIQDTKTHSGASVTFPQQAGSLKVGQYALIRGRPCKLVAVSKHKIGKHGHAKVTFCGLDVFTRQRYEFACPASHAVDVPYVALVEYQLVDIQDDGFLSLLGTNSITRADLKLPSGELGDDVRAKFLDGKNMLLTVLSAVNVEQVMGYKESN